MLKKTDKTGLSEMFKVWTYKHGVLPRLIWLLLIYEMVLSTAESIERIINRHQRRSLSFTALGMCSRSKYQCRLLSAVLDFKVTKCRFTLTCRDSNDGKISGAGIQRHRDEMVCKHFSKLGKKHVLSQRYSW